MELVMVLLFMLAAVCRAASHGIWHNTPKNTHLISERYFHGVEVVREALLVIGGILFTVYCRNWELVPIVLLLCWETFEVFYNKQRKGSWIPKREKLVFPFWKDEIVIEVTGWKLLIVHFSRLALAAFFARIYFS